MQKETARVEVDRPSADVDRSRLESAAGAVETEEILSQAGAQTRQKNRTLRPEVDRRPTLRAR